MDRKEIGSLIRETRRRLGWTQEQLAEGICDPATLSRLENGTQMGGDHTVFLLMEQLGLDPDIAEAVPDPVSFSIDRARKHILDAMRTQDLHAAEEALFEYRSDPVTKEADKKHFYEAAIMTLEGLYLDRLPSGERVGFREWNDSILIRCAEALNLEQIEASTSGPGKGPFLGYDLWQTYGADTHSPSEAGSRHVAESESHISSATDVPMTLDKAIRLLQSNTTAARGSTLEERMLWNAAALAMLWKEELLPAAARIYTTLWKEIGEPRSDQQRRRSIALQANLALTCFLQDHNHPAKEILRRIKKEMKITDDLLLWAQVLQIARAAGVPLTDAEIDIASVASRQNSTSYLLHHPEPHRLGIRVLP